MTLATRNLDFVVIGAAKSGTTSFWQDLDTHPSLATPSDKERGFFYSDGWYERGVEWFVRWAFPTATPDQLLGTVTPTYMALRALDVVVPRMHQTTPHARLVALLRDPIERAVSHYRQALRRGQALAPTFEGHVTAAGTVHPNGGGVVSSGEYGSVLQRYAERFPAEQLLVLYTEDYERDPAATLRRTFTFLGVDPDHEVAARPRLNIGGSRTRVHEEQLDQIVRWLDERGVWAELTHGDDRRRAFGWWLRFHWNIEADQPPPVTPTVRTRLMERYLRDAELLTDLLGAEPPWAARYRDELAAGGD